MQTNARYYRTITSTCTYMYIHVLNETLKEVDSCKIFGFYFFAGISLRPDTSKGLVNLQRNGLLKNKTDVPLKLFCSICRHVFLYGYQTRKITLGYQEKSPDHPSNLLHGSRIKSKTVL